MCRTISVTVLKVVIFTFFIYTLISCQTILAPYKLYIDDVNSFLLISNVDAKVNIEISSDANFKNIISTEDLYFKKGELLEWKYALKKTAKIDSTIYLKANFKDNPLVQPLLVDENNGYAFIQTDKPIYLVTETVRFRAIRLDRTLTPIDEQMVLRIINHQNLKVDDVNLKPGPMKIAEYNYTFPPIAKPSIWSAQLLYGTKSIVRVPIEIAEYVLPIYEIKVDTPKYVLCNSEKVNITTTVTYTFGKPVNGMIHYRFSLSDNGTLYMPFSTSTFLLKNGTNTYELDVQRYFTSMSNDKNSYRLHIEVVVSDQDTGRKDRMFNDRMILTCSKYRIVLKESLLEYKPNIASYISYKIIDPVGDPITDVPTTINLIDTKGEKQIFLSKDYGQGDYSYTFKLNSNIGRLKGFIKIDDPQFSVNRTFFIKPFESEQPAYISIVNKGDRTYRSGDTYRSKIVYHGSIDKERIYAILSSKGKVIMIKKLTYEDYDMIVEFELTNKMVPSVQLLVIAYTSKAEYYATDLTSIEVEQHKCGVDISLPVVDKILPGSNVTFNINGNVGDIVGFQGIDASVGILRKNIFTRSFFKRMLSNDDGHCHQMAALNTHEMLRNLGFRILSVIDDANTMKKMDYQCHQVESKKKPVKRSTRSANNKNFDLIHCCELAYFKYNIRRSCKDRANIIANFTNQECADRFINCCMFQHKRISYSLSAPRVNNDNKASSSDGQETLLFLERVLEKEEENIKTIRSDFRETWLFDLILLNKSVQQYTTKLPDTITSWSLAAVSISQQHGFCLHEPSRLTTFKDFFIKVEFPPTIIQYEHSEIRITAFNYLNTTLRVRVNFNNTAESLCSESIIPEPMYKMLIVDGHSANTIAYPIVGLKEGRFPIEVIATTLKGSDKVVKMITVNPPGILEKKEATFNLDPSKRTKRESSHENHSAELWEISITRNDGKTQTTDVNFKNERMDIVNIVPKTTHYIITAHGDRFSPILRSIEQLKELIKKPKGCGEQNMFYMAYNLYTLFYLNSINKLHESYHSNNQTEQEKWIRKKGVHYLKRAFANQLMFRKEDGSFSAFERRSSSIWLTAFVLKVFCQADPFIGHMLDKTIIKDAIKWLQAEQQNNYWIDNVPLLHGKALGGVSGKFGLTAYITIALNECDQVHNDYLKPLMLKDTITKSEGFLSKELWKSHEIYEQILATYALTYNPIYREQVNTLISQIRNEAFYESANQFVYWKTKTTKYPIETTAYALLLLNKMDPNNTNVEQLQIANWLSGQEVNSVFDNTQNTIVALEALTKFYTRFNQNTINLNQIFLQNNISFNNRWKRSINFDYQNLDTLQMIEVDEGTKNIRFETKGNGLGKVNLLMTFHVFNPEQYVCMFDLDLHICEWNSRNIKVQENEFNGSILFEQIPELPKALGFEKKDSSTSNSIPNRSKNNGRTKRSMNSVLDLFYRRPTTSQMTKKHDKKDNKQSMENYEYMCNNAKFKPIINLNIESNPEIRIMNICLRGTNELVVDNDMVILEISKLTGYQPIDDDLKAIVSEQTHYIDFYENLKSKIIFYFRKVPFARKVCFAFRIYQEYRVSQLQMALVKLYKYYSPESSCSRLYSDIRISTKSSFQCNQSKIELTDDSKTCQCVTEQKCPSTTTLRSIEISRKTNLERARKSFLRLCCKYANIFRVKVINRLIRENSNVVVFEVRLMAKYRVSIPLEDQEFKITLEMECAAIEIGDEVLIMFNEKSFPIHMDNLTTLYKLHSASTVMEFLLRFKKENQIPCL